MEKLRRVPVDVMAGSQVKLTGNDETNNPIHAVGGLRIGREILLPPCPPLDFFSKYWHEAGHVIGIDLSFLNGQVLSPSEVQQMAVQLKSFDAAMLLALITRTNPQTGINTHLLPVANQMLETYTKGNFDANSLVVHTDVPYELMEQVLMADPPTEKGILRGEAGELVTVYTREGRNNELSAVATQAGCLKLLRNTLRVNGLDAPIHLDPPPFPSQYSAHRLVKRAYERGLVIPSVKDLEAQQP